jgi:hypothetical protein
MCAAPFWGPREVRKPNTLCAPVDWNILTFGDGELDRSAVTFPGLLFPNAAAGRMSDLKPLHNDARAASTGRQKPAVPR